MHHRGVLSARWRESGDRLAVGGALDKVAGLVLKSHLRDHVVSARERGDVDEIVAELMEVLKYR